MRLDLEVLRSFDFITATSPSDSECVWVYDCVSVSLKGRYAVRERCSKKGCEKRERGM